MLNKKFFPFFGFLLIKTTIFCMNHETEMQLFSLRDIRCLQERIERLEQENVLLKSKLSSVEALAAKANASAFISECHCEALREAASKKIGVLADHALFISIKLVKRKAAFCKLKNEVSALKDSFKELSKKQDEMSFLNDIFKELQSDIRYRQVLIKAEESEGLGTPHKMYHEYNLGGVS